MAAAVSRPFTNSEAIACLHDIINAFKLPENNIRIEEARDNAGNNMMQMMQIVFPVTTEIQMGVITKYGFSADGDGMIRFSQTIKNFEKLDPEIAELNAPNKDICDAANGCSSPNAITGNTAWVVKPLLYI